MSQNYSPIKAFEGSTHSVLVGGFTMRGADVGGARVVIIDPVISTMVLNSRGFMGVCAGS